MSSSWLQIKYGVPQGSVLGPLLFLIYMNDLPNVCRSIDVFLFADDTNLWCIGIFRDEIERDLSAISNWLRANKLVPNVEKTVQLNIGSASSMSELFRLDDQIIKSVSVFKYLGILLDGKLSFLSHIEYVSKRMSTQCGIISKLRYYVPRNKLILYYNSNIKSIIQYGILIYGCCSFTALNPIFLLQKKIMKFILFGKRYDTSEDLFQQCKILNVSELHTYELLKFVFRSINNHHTQQHLNNIFSFDLKARSTRNSAILKLQVKLCKTKVKRNSIYFRAASLYNVLANAGLLSGNV